MELKIFLLKPCPINGDVDCSKKLGRKPALNCLMNLPNSLISSMRMMPLNQVMTRNPIPRGTPIIDPGINPLPPDFASKMTIPVLFMVVDINGSTVMIIKGVGTPNLLHLTMPLMIIISMNPILIIMIEMVIIPCLRTIAIMMRGNLILILILTMMMITIRNPSVRSMNNLCP
jgi:hypothetical protein